MARNLPNPNSIEEIITYGRGPPLSSSSIKVIISLDVVKDTICGSHFTFKPGLLYSIYLKGVKYLNATKYGC
jgi:hypothetical protein